MMKMTIVYHTSTWKPRMLLREHESGRCCCIWMHMKMGVSVSRYLDIRIKLVKRMIIFS